jgi:hypothetical protein
MIFDDDFRAPVEYEVILLFPGLGTERDNAEEIVLASLQRNEPGAALA